MDPHRLELLLELSRLGSMRLVADSLGVTTSTVSQQLRVLAKEAGVALLEPDGRRVRLTPAGRRLADHAVTILAAIEAARVDLDPHAPPSGTLRVASYATAVRRLLLPVAGVLAAEHPAVRLLIHEHEPSEALGLLAEDRVDLAVTYDYNLAPHSFDRSTGVRPLGEATWTLGVPEGRGGVKGSAAEVFAEFRDADWIVNSRNAADEDVLMAIGALAGFVPRVHHRADSLDLVQHMIIAGLGVGLLPEAGSTLPGVALVGLRDPGLVLRGQAVTRLGRADWPPLALVLRLLAGAAEGLN